MLPPLLEVLPTLYAMKDVKSTCMKMATLTIDNEQNTEERVWIEIPKSMQGKVYEEIDKWNKVLIKVGKRPLLLAYH